MRLFTFTNFRILILLCALSFAALYTLHQNTFTRGWNKSLEVIIFPINGDDSAETQNYINHLRSDDFYDIDRWTIKESRRYNLLIDKPTQVSLGGSINKSPPVLPDTQNPLMTLLWGLEIRWWAFRNTPDNKSNLERIRMFVIYQQGEKDRALPHSLGLQKGLMGIVYAYATKKQNKQNNIVISHELLHIVGATDKYDVSGIPLFPHGYADPARSPLFPQQYAEIMAGHIPVTKTRSHMAKSLKSVVINPHTASEINWIN